MVFMSMHMRYPLTEEEAATYVPLNQLNSFIIAVQVSFMAFSFVNRYILERRERILYLSKIATQQQHF